MEITRATQDVQTLEPLTRWMRIVGAFYLAQFVAMAIVHAPIRTFGPAGALDAAKAGDPIASFLVDTWTTFGIEVGAIGLALVLAAPRPRYAWGVAATVMAIELTRGLINDSIFIARDIEVAGYLVWIAIHSVVLLTGALSLRRASSPSSPDGEVRRLAIRRYNKGETHAHVRDRA